MTDKPIPFTAPMVRALLAGRKTQTRRLPDQPPPECSINYLLGNESWLPVDQRSRVRRTFEAWGGELFRNKPEKALCGSFDIVPRYQPGDRLYVREAWRTFVSLDKTKPRDLWSPGCGRGAGILYEADDSGLSLTETGERYIGTRDDRAPFGRFRPPMFMPRWASRLTLFVTDVRIEPLHTISDADAIAEGARISAMTGFDGGGLVEGDAPHIYCAPRTWYRELWETINGAGSWDKNPWIVVPTFTVEHRNIDAPPLPEERS